MAYDDPTEFERRYRVAHASTTTGALQVFRSQLEVFFRSMMKESLSAAMDRGSKSIDVKDVLKVVKSLEGPIDLSITAPLGLVRHAQFTMVRSRSKRGREPEMNSAIGFFQSDMDAVEADKDLCTKQLTIERKYEDAIKNQAIERKRQRTRIADKKCTVDSKLS